MASRLVVIDGALALKVPLPNPRRLLWVERYLWRQSRNAHNLDVPILEHYYLYSGACDSANRICSLM
jgi:hypothetical protein